MLDEIHYALHAILLNMVSSFTILQLREMEPDSFIRPVFRKARTITVHTVSGNCGGGFKGTGLCGKDRRCIGGIITASWEAPGPQPGAWEGMLLLQVQRPREPPWARRSARQRHTATDSIPTALNTLFPTALHCSIAPTSNHRGGDLFRCSNR